jgi:peptide/nickel transport system ATP-binding protein
MLQVHELRVGLDSDAGLVKAIDGISLSINAGETFALVGESGCGKSMTALALLRLLPDNGRGRGGDVRLAVGDQSTDVLALTEAQMRGLRGAGVGIIFQEPATSLNPVMRVGAQITEVIEAHSDLRGDAAQAKALQWLARVGIREPEQAIAKYPFQMSGGQKQRVMIAIALAAQPRVLIADEPTTALDVTIQAQILDLLRELQRELGMGLLLITHDLAVVKNMAQRVALMYAGQIVETAPTPEFFANPRHPYAYALLEALPDVAKRGAPLAAIGGTVPALTQSFGACRFAPRCPLAQAACQAGEPVLSALSPTHSVRCVGASEFGHLSEVAELIAIKNIATKPASMPANAQKSTEIAAAQALLKVQSLRVEFPAKQGFLSAAKPGFVAVDGIDFELRAGQTLALVGESGCGKTTTGKALMRLLDRNARVSGQMLLDGADIGSMQGDALLGARRRMQIIFQDPFASLNPRMRVGDILQEGMRALQPAWDEAERRARITALLDRVGLRPDAVARYPHEFSGGQRQRVAIARALAVEPKLIICDEPTSALDVSVQAQILNLLEQLQRELGVAYLFITHNFGVVEYFADHIAVMQKGRIVEAGAALEVLGSPKADYTKTLLSAVPRL